MDLKQGLICGLTNQKAEFENECPDYKLDETVKEVQLDDKDALQTHEIKKKLPIEILEKIRLEQNLIPAILSGFLVGVIGAVIWATISVATGYQIGYMAIAIGAGVGLTIRKIGNGIDYIFGFWGAGISLFSVMFGNFLSIVALIADEEGLGYFETLTLFDYNYLPDLMIETFSFIDLIFYGIAIYEGFQFSFRLVTEKRIEEIKNSNK